MMMHCLMSASAALLLQTHIALGSSQIPLHAHQEAPSTTHQAVSAQLFSDLEQSARIVDISYCVGLAGTGVSKPFQCLSRCSDFPDFELVKTWNTGPLMSDSCGYLALDHSTVHPRILVAFRGSYSIANAVVDLSTIPQEYAPYPDQPSHEGTIKCHNCTVHSGFFRSWKVTSDVIRTDIQDLLLTYPTYQLHLIGHSLGGAVAALAGLDFLSHGWHPIVTTFGEPRIGNKGLVTYLDAMFGLNQTATRSGPLDPDALNDYEANLSFRRVTHIDDPVPQLPLTEWGFRMHAGEIYISKSSLSPDVQDVQHCFGDEDSECIASQDTTLLPSSWGSERSNTEDDTAEAVKEGSLKAAGGSLTIPSRYRLWQMLFSHRDYFWRLGLCVPSGTPWEWGRESTAGRYARS